MFIKKFKTLIKIIKDESFKNGFKKLIQIFFKNKQKNKYNKEKNIKLQEIRAYQALEELNQKKQLL